jgi:hypothetical protein
LNGYWYTPFDGLRGRVRARGEIPDIVLLYYAGLDIATHYPRRFKQEEDWEIDEIQRWYLREVLDPELGKVAAFLREHNLFENTVFLFISDHGQTKIRKRLSDEDFERRLSESLCVAGCALDQELKIFGRGHSIEEADVVIMPGAGTKTIYVKNRLDNSWVIPPRLLADIKPVIDGFIDQKEIKECLNHLLIRSYLGDRFEGMEEIDAFWVFDITEYRRSDRHNTDFVGSLAPLSRLDEFLGASLNAAFMYRRNYSRENTPDIILINKPGYFFTRNDEIYGH